MHSVETNSIKTLGQAGRQSRFQTKQFVPGKTISLTKQIDSAKPHHMCDKSYTTSTNNDLHRYQWVFFDTGNKNLLDCTHIKQPYSAVSPAHFFNTKLYLKCVCNKEVPHQPLSCWITRNVSPLYRITFTSCRVWLLVQISLNPVLIHFPQSENQKIVYFFIRLTKFQCIFSVDRFVLHLLRMFVEISLSQW